MKYLLPATVFVAGAALMIMEIVGGRILIPHFGDSVIIWGSLISVILIAMSAGYYLGGMLADRHPTRDAFAAILFAQGIFVLLIPLLADKLLSSLSGQSIYAPFWAAHILFLLPSIFAGMVSPYAVKLGTKNLKALGKSAGSLYAIATLGSVLGTLGTSFVFLLHFTTNSILHVTGTVLIGISGLAGKRTRIAFLSVFVLLGIALAVQSMQHEEPVLLDQPLDVTIESLYGPLHVSDRAGIRTLSIAGGQMSAMNISDPLAHIPGWDYVECMEAGYLVNPDIEEVLVIGVGGGVYLQRLQQLYGADITAVDINSRVIDVAQEYFFIQDEIELNVGDGRTFLEAQGSYDFITLDVSHYHNYTYRVPFHLTTKEFFELAADHLNEDGVFATHIISKPGKRFPKSVIRTLTEVFPTIYTMDCNWSQIILATNAPKATPQMLSQNMPKKAHLTKYFYEEPIDTEVPLLLDRLAPISPFPEAIRLR